MHDQDLSRVLEAGGSALPDADPYVARVRLKFKPDRIRSPQAAEARQSAVRSGAEAAGKERAAGSPRACDPLRDAQLNIARFYEQWKTKTIHASIRGLPPR